MPQPLNAREANLFRNVIRHYEEKQYKRGLKVTEQILRKNPRHADTMAMKALLVNGQGKADEAFALAKEALTVDMKSHICWHVYGILYRTAKNFDEAIKAYKFALKLEPDSPQIQRDLAVLQIQMRDYPGYIQSRLTMLKARGQVRQNWTGLAIAHHLAGNLKEAENVLSTYESTLKNPPPKTDLEHSEAVLYKNSIIAEMGDTERALEHLESSAKHNLDRLAVLELRATYLGRLGRKEEAAKAYRALLNRNSEHAAYYEGLIRVLGLESDELARKAVYDKYAEKLPRCDAARRLPLDFLTGENFIEAAKKYMAFMLDKGVPSLFANLKCLYSDSFKKDTLLRLAKEYLDERSSGEEGGDVKGAKESIKGATAALYFLAQHYDYYMSRHLDQAMEYIEKAISRKSGQVEFHVCKARIYKHQGNLVEAADVMDHARSLDTKDRYINSKAAKYQLRTNQNERALKTMSLFTRAESAAGPLADLLDMQCVWFLTEDGEAYARQGSVGLALKRFHAVFNIFETWQEDQFDFHTFSLRKGLIRAYIDMVRWEDRLHEHPFYSRAALDAIRVYLDMYDHPKGSNGTKSGDDELQNGQDTAEKKAAKKARKEAQRAEREAAKKAAKQDPNKGKEAESIVKRDDDPNGLKLAAIPDPLGEATKFLTPLLQFSPKKVDAQVLGFDVFMRKKKYILALKCLKTAQALDSEQLECHRQAVEFAQVLRSESIELPPAVLNILKTEFTLIPEGSDLNKVNDDFRNRHANSVRHAVAALQTAILLGQDKSQAQEELAGLVEHENITFPDASAILDLLRKWGSPKVCSFREAAHKKWSGVSAFF